jgi:hypothetical protein
VIIQTDKPLPPRRENDFYPTPEYTVRSALELIPEWWVPKSVFDPGAGDGIWGRIARLRWPEMQLVGAELRDVPKPPEYDEWSVGNFLGNLGPLAHYEFDLVVGNPPYRDAEAFVRRSLALLRDRGQLVFLLRLAFLESQRRRDGLFKEFPPKTVGVCSKRPSFTGDGKTNATAFAVFHWMKGYAGSTRLTWFA